MDLIRQGYDLATNKKYSKWTSWALVAGEGLLCALIILRVPCEHDHPVERGPKLIKHLYRHRDRLENIYATSPNILER